MVIVTVISLMTIGCSQEDPPAERQNAVPVELTVVSARALVETASIVGVLDAYREVNIVSEVSGEIVALLRDVGDQVVKGAPLASIEKEVMRETLNQAEATLMAAEARLTLAAGDFRRDSTLHANGDIAEAANDASRTTYRASLAEVKAARAARELAARDLQEADIRAPFAGIVSRRYCEVGLYVTPGMPVFRVVDIDSLRLILSASQKDLARLTVGSEVVITPEDATSRSFAGRIRSIAPEADETTHTFPVEVILANPPGRPLRDGHVVRAALPLGQREEKLAVPREALLRRAGGEFVFVVNDSTARRRAVKSGVLIEDQYTIEEGLSPGERVVTVGMANLEDGSIVHIESVRKMESSGSEVPR
jgi:RND family efflux transporter MFP subunit